MSGPSTDLQRTAVHWSAEGTWQPGRGIHWLELSAVQHRLNQKVSGRSDVDWIGYTLMQHFPGGLPLSCCLSLGCGQGGLERRLASEDAFVTCDAFDIAQGSIAKARLKAMEAGCDHINYAVQDANHVSLPARQYDAIWSFGAVHHFERLEHVFQQVAASLKVDGLFVLNEYVGPSRFQFPHRQREVIQACHDLLPVKYRKLTGTTFESSGSVSAGSDWRWLARRVMDKLHDGDLLRTINRRLRQMKTVRSGHLPIKEGVNLPTERSVKAVDPSEAVRSAEIVPLLERYFRIIERKELGGSILQFLLADIAGNFQDPGGGPLLELLFAIEDTLMESGDLTSDFVYILAAPLSAPEKRESH